MFPAERLDLVNSCTTHNLLSRRSSAPLRVGMQVHFADMAIMLRTSVNMLMREVGMD